MAQTIAERNIDVLKKFYSDETIAKRVSGF